MPSYLDIDWSSPINWDHPLNDGTVGWWLNVPHWQGGTTWRDLTGRNHGALTNMDPATDWKTGGRPGGWGALDFDGANDYVEATIPPSLTTSSDVTVSLWVKNLGGNALRGVFNLQVGATSSGQLALIYFWTDANNSLLVSHLQIGSYSTIPATDFTDGNWNHITLVQSNAARGTIYINGKKNSQDSTTVLTPFGSNVVRMAQGANASYYANCQMDDVRVRRGLLDASEVALLYQQSRLGYPDMLRYMRRRAFMPVAAAAGAPILYRPHRAFEQHNLTR